MYIGLRPMSDPDEAKILASRPRPDGRGRSRCYEADAKSLASRPRLMPAKILVTRPGNAKTLASRPGQILTRRPKFPSQVYHMPMPSYTVAYYVAYSLEWIDSLRLSSTLHALPTPPPQRPSKLSGSASISGTPSGKNGVDMFTPVHPVATPLRELVLQRVRFISAAAM